MNSLYSLSKKDQSSALIAKKTNSILNNNNKLAEVYKINREEDGWLYLKL